MDKDNSGRLSLDAFMQLMANKMAEKDTKEEIMKVCHDNLIRNTRKHIFDTKHLLPLESELDNQFIMIPDRFVLFGLNDYGFV